MVHGEPGIPETVDTRSSVMGTSVFPLELYSFFYPILILQFYLIEPTEVFSFVLFFKVGSFA